MLLVIVAALMSIVGRVNEVAGDIAPTLLYYMNWTKAMGHDPGYLSHAWSLSIEEQFYIAWPVMLIVGLYLSRGRLLPIAAAAVAGAVAIVAWRAILWSPEAFDRVYWSTDARADALLIGCAAALLVSMRAVPAPAVLAGASIAALVVVMLTADVGSFAVVGLAVVALASVPLIILATRDGPISRVLGWRPLVHVGTISYGLYLFHRPIMRVGDDLGFSGEVVPFLAMVLVSFGVASLSWRYVERPFIRLKSRIAMPTGRSDAEPDCPRASVVACCSMATTPHP